MMGETPLEDSSLLMTHIGRHLLQKREDPTEVQSFKVRGAYSMTAESALVNLRRNVAGRRWVTTLRRRRWPPRASAPRTPTSCRP